jgi:hypothetical protein
MFNGTVLYRTRAHLAAKDGWEPYAESCTHRPIRVR